jgi:hypothetical protein
MATQLYGMVLSDATVISYDVVLRLAGIAFALSIPLVLLLRIRSAAPVSEPIEI